MQKIRKKESVRFSLAMIVLVVLSAMVFFVYALYLNTYFQKELQKGLIQNMKQTRYDIETSINEAFLILEVMAISLSQVEKPLYNDSLQELHNQYKLFTLGTMLIIDTNGKTSTSTGTKYDLSQRSYFKRALEGEPSISPIEHNIIDGKSGIVFAVPIKNSDVVTGVFAFGISLTQFKNLIHYSTISTDSFSYILESNGSIVAKTDINIEYFEESKEIENHKMQIADLLKKKKNETGLYRANGTAFFVSYMPLNINDWYIVTFIPSTAYDEERFQLLKISFAAFVILSLLLTGLLSAVYFMQQAITQKLRRSEEQYRLASEHDALTGLLNKGTSNTLITQILNESHPHKNTHALFIIDIDDFKSINDTLGHIYGDEVLHSIGEKLKNAFRENDITSRIGGDEFAVFVRDVDSLDTVNERAQKITHIFRNELAGKNKNYKVSGSTGVALYPEHGQTYAELYKKADEALYIAKKTGKDQYRLYNSHT